jgi:putative transposase
MQAPDLTALKAEGPFLRDVPHHTLQQALMDLRHATERWRSGAAGRPRYEGRYADDSFRFPDPRQVTVLAIGLKLKAGVVPWVMHWPVPPGAVARREGKQWYAAVLRERPDDLATAQPIASPEAVNDLIVLGVDVGIERAARL